MPPTPPHQVIFSLFVAFSFGFNFVFFFKPLPNLPKPPKIVQKASKTLPKTLPKPHQNRILSCNARNPKKIRPSYTKPSFLTFSCLRKSSQNRCQNPFIIGSILTALLETPKILIWMLKRRQDGPQKFHYFPKKSVKNCNYSGLWFMLLLGSLQDPPKSLPRACQEGPRRRTSPPEAPKSPQEAPVQQNKTQEASDINQNFRNFAGHKCPNP